ncbi:MAG: radical SAM protein [Chlamydiota bacterium]|nr:radical SAM protein [Chlamydiota bacterium]
MKNTGMKQLFLSRFARVFEKDGLVALIHQLQPEPVYLSKKMWYNIVASATIEIPMNRLAAELVAHKLLIADPYSDRQILEDVRRRTLHSLNRPTILYLMMAPRCNFACTYCPIPALAERYTPQLLSFEDAVAGITLWKKHIEEYPKDDNSYFLIFYGGEPLLNCGVFKRLLAYVSKEYDTGQLPQKLKLVLCTNGSLIDEQLMELLIRHHVTVSIGIDGQQEHNDRTRITSDSNSTFSGLERVIKQLVENGIRVTASVIITPTNVHQLEKYPNFLQKLGIAQFGFNLMKGNALTRQLNGGSMENYCRSSAQGILSGLANANKNGQCYEYQLEKKLVALQNGSPFSVDCTCYGNQLVIQADGQVSNCPFLRIDQGHVRELPDTFRIWQTDTVKTWRRRIPLFNEKIIRDDNVDILDGGGCAWSSFELYGDVSTRDINNAIFTKEVMHELIWTLLPTNQANAIRRGKTTHWSYRRVRNM